MSWRNAGVGGASRPIRAWAGCAFAMAWMLFLPEARAGERVVSGAGSITETIHALGAAEMIVGVDSSSVFPPEASKHPQVGYARQLSAEGILSVNPTVLFLSDDAGPPNVIKQVEQAGVRVIRLPSGHTPEAAAERILRIGTELGRGREAKELVARLQSELSAVSEKVARSGARPRVMFIYARGGGVMNVSGTGTSADAIIALAGGTNAVTDYSSYKPLTAEGAVAAAPEFILLTTRGLESAGGVDALLKLPGLSLTPAGASGRVIAMDDLLLLGFGPRLGKAALELCERLHGASTTARK